MYTYLLDGQDSAYYRDWLNLTNVPAGFTDCVDADTIYTDVDALNAVETAGYITSTDVIQVISDTGTITVDGAPTNLSQNWGRSGVAKGTRSLQRERDPPRLPREYSRSGVLSVDCKSGADLVPNSLCEAGLFSSHTKRSSPRPFG